MCIRDRLYQKNSGSTGADLFDNVENLVYKDRGETHGGLIHKDDPWLGHEGTSHGKHLLLSLIHIWFALVTEQKNSFLDDIESFLLGSEYFVECFSMGDLFAPASADVDLESIFAVYDGVEAAVDVYKRQCIWRKQPDKRNGLFRFCSSDPFGMWYFHTP